MSEQEQVKLVPVPELMMEILRKSKVPEMYLNPISTFDFKWTEEEGNIKDNPNTIIFTGDLKQEGKRLGISLLRDYFTLFLERCTPENRVNIPYQVTKDTLPYVRESDLFYAIHATRSADEYMMKEVVDGFVGKGVLMLTDFYSMAGDPLVRNIINDIVLRRLELKHNRTTILTTSLYRDGLQELCPEIYSLLEAGHIVSMTTKTGG